jgi:tetratricopeptide (TPR) repeat protein
VAAGDFPTAIRQLENVRQDPAVQSDRGLAAMVNEALRAAHLAYGNRLLEQGKLDDSYAEFKAILDIAPDDPDAIDGQKRVILTKNYGIMEANWGQDDEAAIRALETNIQIDANFRETRPKLYALLIAKADRMLAAGDRDGAYPVLMRALAVIPDRPEAMQRLRPYTPTPIPVPPTRAPPTAAPYVPPAGPSEPFTPPGAPV